MTYAGVSIESYNFNPAKFNIYYFIAHILEAGAILTLHGIIHRDLHRGNILLDKRGMPRIIDFGLTLFKQKKYVIDDFLFGYDPKYNQEPPEFSLWNVVEDSKSMFFMKKSLGGVIKEIVDTKPIISSSRVITKKTRDQQIQDLEEYINSSKSFIERDFTKWWDTYWSKVDAWSIGAIITALISKLSAFPSFNTNQSYTAHKDKIHSIVSGLLELDPRKRIDLVEALHMFNPNSYVLKKYGADWLKMRIQQKVKGAPGMR
jgi:serine/threonine protein kinase